MLRMVEFLHCFLIDGRIDPGVGEQPGVPDHRITRFQPVICPACALSCLASNAVATTAPGKCATANSLAETGFGLVVRLRVSPGVDEIPYSQLVCVGQALKQPDKIPERPLVVIRPRENEVERLPRELVELFVRCTAAGARRVVTPAGPVVGKSELGTRVQLSDAHLPPDIWKSRRQRLQRPLSFSERSGRPRQPRAVE